MNRGGGRRGGFPGRGGGRGHYTNPCITMHQPWASLLVAGIKRIEGRSWPAPLTGRIWIHAASKIPEQETINAMEEFYKEIYAINGISDITFPDHYPVSRLLGCVDVVGCVRQDELVCWQDVPESVRLEALTDYCWLCENPQKLVVPFEMRGFQGVYNLERRIHDAAVRGLRPVQGPLAVKFPLPNCQDPFSLRPGSLQFSSKSAVGVTPEIAAAIAGARSAATQFSKKENNVRPIAHNEHKYENTNQEEAPSTGSLQETTAPRGGPRTRSMQVPMQGETSSCIVQKNNKCQGTGPYINASSGIISRSGIDQTGQRSVSGGGEQQTNFRSSPRIQYGGSDRIIAAALRDVKLQ